MTLFVVIPAFELVKESGFGVSYGAEVNSATGFGPPPWFRFWARRVGFHRRSGAYAG
jgi:hypothetical protein